MGCSYIFGMYEKKRPISIPWYQISIPQAFIFKFIGGCCNNPHWLDVLKNRLVSMVRRGLNHNSEVELDWGNALKIHTSPAENLP